MFNTNPWLYYSTTSNKLTNTYIQGILDISGNIVLRNGGFRLPNGDLSMNGNLYVGLDTTVRGNVNIQGNLVVNKRVLQTLKDDPSYNSVNGYYALADNVQPIVSKQTAYDAGQNWQSAVSGVNSNNWFNICWSSELRLFCAVAWTGTTTERIMVSNDGLNWRNALTGVISNDWATICWAPQLGLFCAVANTGGTNDRVMVSSDGLNWSSTGINGVLGNQWYGICWSPELGLFCAVGITGNTNERVMLSRNGYTWTPATSGVLDNLWCGICWAPELGLFCAVAVSGTTTGRVMVSSDGYNWRNAISGVISNDWRNICWSPELGLFCAVTSVAGGTNDRVMVSSDGLNWRSAISGVLGIVWSGICWSPELGLFCAVAYSGGTTNQNVMVSSDGLNWRNAISGVLTITWNQVCWSPELSIFCGVGQSGTTNQRIMITNPIYRLPTTKSIQTLTNDGYYNINIASTSSGTFPNFRSTATGPNLISIGNGNYKLVGNLLSNSIAIGNTILSASNQNGYGLIGIGQNVFPQLTTGFQNIGIGNAIATSMTIGYNNVFIGNSVATSTLSTGNTVAIGTNAGFTNATGINNTYLGAFTGANAGAYSNSTAIGYGATITASNQIKLGTANETTNIDGNLIVNKTIQTTNLTVSGTTSLISDITLPGNLIVNNTTPSYNVNSGSFQLKGGAGILGNVFINQNLSVAQNSTFSGNVSLNGIQNTFTGDVSMNGNLQVNRTSIFNGNVVINGNIIFTKDVSMNGNLQVGKNATVGGDVSMNGNLYVGKNSTLIGNVSISRFSNLRDASMNGNISVSGETTLVGNVNIQGNLVVNKRVLQTLKNDTSYNAVNGYYALAENVQPIVSKKTAYDIGQNWMMVPDNFTASCARIRWSSKLGIFCSVGNDGVAVISNDGLNWRQSNHGLGNCNSVCWSPELGIFVAVSYNFDNRCSTSPDGLVWTRRPSLSKLISWSDVCWSPELGIFVAVGSGSISETINNSNVAVSSDGITWYAATSGVMNYYWRSVCWSAELGLFCAVSLSSASTKRIMVSRDGYNWSNDTNNTGSGDWSGICWSSELGLFCATGYSNILVSSDGYNWRTTPTGGTLTFHQITWAAEIGLFCAVSDGGAGQNQIIISRDGLNWITATSGVDVALWYGIAWSPELSIFCAMAYGVQNKRIMITNPIYRLPTTKSIQTLTNDGNYNINIKSTALDNFPPDYYKNNVNMIKIGNNSFFDLSYISFNETFDNASTKGTFNWDLSANNGNTTTEITNPGTYLSMYSMNAVGFKSINLPIAYSSTKFKNISFNISLANGRNVQPFLLGISDNISIFNATNKIGFNIFNNNANDGSMNIFVNVNGTNVSTLTSSAYPNIQYILDINFFSNYIVFSVANANTPTIIIGSYTSTSMPNYNSYIGAYFYSNTAVGNSRFAYIHDIKWTLSSDITRFNNSISIGDTNKQNIPYTSYVNKYSNIGIGKNIFPALLQTGLQNIGIGNAISTSMTSGNNNVFIGSSVNTSTTSTGNTVAIGASAGSIILPATILHYPFDIDTLNYASGVGVVNGTLQGAAISNTNYKVGSGSLNGNSGIANNYFSIPSVPKNNNGYSFSFWIYMNVSSWTGMAFTFDGNGRIFAYVNGGIMQFATGSSNFSTITIPVQTWTHFAWTITTGSASTIYVNGSLYTTTTFIPYISNAGAFTSCRICGDPQGNQYGINGYLDDFRYFDAIITSSTVQSLFITNNINNTYLGAFTKASSGTYNNSTAIGFGATIDASNEIVLGTLTQHIRTPGNPYWVGALQSIANTSDIRNIVAYTPLAATTSNRITIHNAYFLLLPEFAYGVYQVNLVGNPDQNSNITRFTLYMFQFSFPNATVANMVNGTPTTVQNYYLARTSQNNYIGATSVQGSASITNIFEYASGTQNRAFSFAWGADANSGVSNAAQWTWITIHKIA